MQHGLNCFSTNPTNERPSDIQTRPIPSIASITSIKGGVGYQTQRTGREDCIEQCVPFSFNYTTDRQRPPMCMYVNLHGGAKGKGERHYDKRSRQVKRTDSGREGRGKRRESNEERKKGLETCFSYSVSGEMKEPGRRGWEQTHKGHLVVCFDALFAPCTMYMYMVQDKLRCRGSPGASFLSFFFSFLAISRCVEKRRCVVVCACVQERQQARHGPKRYLRGIHLPHMLHNNQPYTRMNSKPESIVLCRVQEHF